MEKLSSILTLEAYTVSVSHIETTYTGVMKFLKNNVFVFKIKQIIIQQ